MRAAAPTPLVPPCFSSCHHPRPPCPHCGTGRPRPRARLRHLPTRENGGAGRRGPLRGDREHRRSAGRVRKCRPRRRHGSPSEAGFTRARVSGAASRPATGEMGGAGAAPPWAAAAPPAGSARVRDQSAPCRPRGPGARPTHLPLVVLAVDLHEVLLHLDREVLRGEVLHVQEDDELVPVRSDLKGKGACGCPRAEAQGPRGQRPGPRGAAQSAQCNQSLARGVGHASDLSFHAPGDKVPGTPDPRTGLGFQGSDVCRCWWLCVDAGYGWVTDRRLVGLGSAGWSGLAGAGWGWLGPAGRAGAGRVDLALAPGPRPCVFPRRPARLTEPALPCVSPHCTRSEHSPGLFWPQVDWRCFQVVGET